MKWPTKSDQIKHVSDKTDFIDTCQYEADKTPGPGNYNIRTIISQGPSDKKWSPHPVKPKETSAAEVGTYSPCAV